METSGYSVLLCVIWCSFALSMEHSQIFSEDVLFHENLESSFLFNGNSIENNLESSAIQINPKCLYDLKLYSIALSKRELWAIKMFDSTGKLPDGMMRGHLASLGNFDECLSIKEIKPNITAKYCLVFKLPPKMNGSEGFDVLGLFIRRGLCIPKSCSSHDVEIILKKNTGNVTSTIYVPEEGCTVDEPEDLDAGDIVYIALVSVITFVIVIATFLGVIEAFIHPSESNYKYSRRLFPGQRTKFQKVCDFSKKISVVENFKKIFNVKRNERAITCLDGIRFFSMCWVLFGHSLYDGLPMEYSNLYDIYEYFRQFWTQCFFNATLAVDTFFVISGMLWGFTLLKQLSKLFSSKENKPPAFQTAKLIGMSYVMRYLRLTPCLAILIGLTATVLRKMRSGPIWNIGISGYQQNCRSYWWTDLLYVQNYVNPSEMCLNHSWYLACDTQFFIISPFLMLMVIKKEIIGLSAIILLILGSNIYVCVYTAMNHGIPTNIMNWHFLDVSFGDYWNDIYVAGHARFGPYGIGLLLGYLFYRYNNNMWRPAFVYVVVGWCISIATGLGVVYGMYRYNNDPHRQVINADAAFYAGFHRTAWAMAVAWLIFACHFNYGGVVNKILSLSIFIPLGRLTYCMYLLSYLIQIWIAMSVRAGFFFDGLVVPYYIFFGSVAFTFLVSIIYSLFIEGPSVAVIKLIGERQARSRSNNKTRGPIIENSANVYSERVSDGISTIRNTNRY